MTDYSSIEKRLRELKKIEPNSPWKIGLRSLILKENKKATIPTFSLSFSKPLAVGALFVLFFFGVAFLSQKSLPGEDLYTVKRGYENLVLQTKSEKLALQQEYTVKRIQELKQLSLEKKGSVETAIKEIKQSVSSVQSQVASARASSDPQTTQALNELPQTIERSKTDLTQIRPTLSESEQKEVGALLNSLKDLETEVNRIISPENTLPTK